MILIPILIAVHLLCWAGEDRVLCHQCYSKESAAHRSHGYSPYYERETDLTREKYSAEDGCESCLRTFVDWRQPNQPGVSTEERIEILEDQVKQMKRRWPGAFHQGKGFTGFKGSGTF